MSSPEAGGREASTPEALTPERGASEKLPPLVVVNRKLTDMAHASNASLGLRAAEGQALSGQSVVEVAVLSFSQNAPPVFGHTDLPGQRTWLMATAAL